MAEHQLPKLNTRVRFPSSAPVLTSANAVRTVRSHRVDVTGFHNSVQSGSGSHQRIVLAVRLEPHRQAGGLMSYPGGDNGDRDTLQMHQRGAGVAGGVQLDVPDVRRLERVSPVSGQKSRRSGEPRRT
jgi:hypothetical protein